MATKGDSGIRESLVKLGGVCKLTGMIWLRGEMDAAERRGKEEQSSRGRRGGPPEPKGRS